MKRVSWLHEDSFANPGARMSLPEPRDPLPRGRSRVRDLPPPADAKVYSTSTPERRRQIERMVPIAVNLAQGAKEHGVTVADIRKAAQQRNIITGAEQGRALNYIWQVPGAAGLVRQGTERRRSDIGISHGNLQQVWVLPEFAQ